jgi:hypothetical protein
MASWIMDTWRVRLPCPQFKMARGKSAGSAGQNRGTGSRE